MWITIIIGYDKGHKMEQVHRWTKNSGFDSNYYRNQSLQIAHMIVKLFYKIHLLEGRSVELILFFVLVCEHLCSQSQAQSKGNKLNLVIPLALASPF